MKKNIITITGPSGVGKTFVLNHLIDSFREDLGIVCQLTCREPRLDDDKKLIKTVTPNIFNKETDAFFVYHGNYGIHKHDLFNVIDDGKIPIFLSGYREVMKLKNYAKEFYTHTILIDYPNFNYNILKERTSNRNYSTETLLNSFNFNKNLKEKIYTNKFLDKYIDYKIYSDNSLKENSVEIINDILSK